MIPITYGPEWFNLSSLIIDFISLFVLALIGINSFKYYKLNKENKRYLYLSGSFFLICLSFVFKLITDLTIYYESLESIYIGPIAGTLEVIRGYNIFSLFTFSSFVLFNLLGLYFLYNLYNKESSKSHMFLVIYFIILSTYLSSLSYFIFHLTSLFFLIIISMIYLKRYVYSKHRNTKLLYFGFSILALSQIFFMFIILNQYFYVLAELTQLFGYSILLVTLIMVLNYGKKAK